jgi:DnaJ homologue, subfamily C, member 28, conserved domain
MTARKPPGVSWESWIDKQIREAEERGEFENLPGAGQPIPNLDKPFDELWWVKNKLHREGLSYMPPSVALRKEAHDALEAISRARSEADVRRLIADINEKIREANRKGIRGPSLMLMPFDVERVVKQWHEQRSRKAVR